jgi:hypothetical protein
MTLVAGLSAYPGAATLFGKNNMLVEVLDKATDPASHPRVRDALLEAFARQLRMQTPETLSAAGAADLLDFAQARGVAPSLSDLFARFRFRHASGNRDAGELPASAPSSATQEPARPRSRSPRPVP